MEETLTRDKHCEFLSANARDRAAAMADWFKLFVQLYSAIVGGALLLRLQYKAIPANLVSLADWLVVLVIAVSALMVMDSYRAWRRYRKTLMTVAGQRAGTDIIPRPPWTSWIGITLMLVAMLAALFGFLCFNPLRY
jgi:hypothetical protein